MTNVVTSDMGRMLASVQSIGSVPDAVQFVKRVDALKSALESVDAFYEQAVKYAQLEVAALLRVIELGGLAQLRGTHKAVAEWLVSISDEDRQVYVSMCAEGITIDEVYKREIKPSIVAEKDIRLAEIAKHEAIEEYDKRGMVDLKQHAESIRGILPSDKYGTMANDFIDGIRRELRSGDAIGCGDGIYVSRKIEDHPLGLRTYEKAMEIRYKSLWNDIFSMLDIASAAGHKINSASLASHYKTSSLYHFEQQLLELLTSIGIFE